MSVKFTVEFDDGADLNELLDENELSECLGKLFDSILEIDWDAEISEKASDCVCSDSQDDEVSFFNKLNLGDVLERFPMSVNTASDAEIRQNILDLIKERGITLAECADRIHVDPRELAAWLEDGNSVPLSYLYPLAECLNVSLVELLVPNTNVKAGDYLLDMAPLMRLRQLARLLSETRQSESLRRCCFVNGNYGRKIHFENPYITWRKDNEATGCSLELSPRTRSCIEMPFEEAGVFVDALAQLSKKFYLTCPDFNMDLGDIYRDFFENKTFDSVNEFLVGQTICSYLMEHELACVAPDEDGDWNDMFIALGCATKDMQDDFDDTCIDFSDR